MRFRTKQRIVPIDRRSGWINEEENIENSQRIKNTRRQKAEPKKVEPKWFREIRIDLTKMRLKEDVIERDNIIKQV